MPIYGAATLAGDGAFLGNPAVPAGAPFYDRVVIRRIPPGIAGTRATLEEIERQVQLGKRSPEVAELAEEVLARFGARPHDERSQIEAVRRGLRVGLFYVRDPRGVETLRDARKLAAKMLAHFRAGGRRPLADCDDFTIVGRALLEHIGYATKSRGVGTMAPGRYNHVYPMVRLSSGRWIGVEATTRRFPRPAWAPPSTTAPPMDVPALGQAPAAPPSKPWYAAVTEPMQQAAIDVLRATMPETMERTMKPAVEQLRGELKFLKYVLLAVAAAGAAAAYFFVVRAHRRAA